MSTTTIQRMPDDYALGEPHPNHRDTARFYTKPASAGHTGGGYELWRSVERRPHTPGRDAEDVYVAHHRLLAVVACYPSSMPIADVLDDLAGKDVHHTTGVPWANFGDSPNFDAPGLEVVGHGEHAEITQSQRRAWAADAKREVEQAEQQPLDADRGEACDGCGETTTDPLATADEWDGQWCIDCIQAHRERQQALADLEEIDL